MSLKTPDEIKDELKVSSRTVRNWLEEGKLPGIRLSARAWRVRSEDLDAFLQERRSNGSKLLQLAEEASVDMSGQALTDRILDACRKRGLMRKVVGERLEEVPVTGFDEFELLRYPDVGKEAFKRLADMVRAKIGHRSENVWLACVNPRGGAFAATMLCSELLWPVTIPHHPEYGKLLLPDPRWNRSHEPAKVVFVDSVFNTGTTLFHTYDVLNSVLRSERPGERIEAVCLAVVYNNSEQTQTPVVKGSDEAEDKIPVIAVLDLNHTKERLLDMYNQVVGSIIWETR